jgi:hypothetical protein
MKLRRPWRFPRGHGCPRPTRSHARMRLTCPVSLISIDSVAAWACSNCLRTREHPRYMSHISQPMHHKNRSWHLPPTIFRRDRRLSQMEVRKERTRKLAEERAALASLILAPCQVCGKHQSLQSQTELGGTRLLRKQRCRRPHPYVGRGTGTHRFIGPEQAHAGEPKARDRRGNPMKHTPA